MNRRIAKHNNKWLCSDWQTKTSRRSVCGNVNGPLGRFGCGRFFRLVSTLTGTRLFANCDRFHHFGLRNHERNDKIYEPIVSRFVWLWNTHLPGVRPHACTSLRWWWKSCGCMWPRTCIDLVAPAPRCSGALVTREIRRCWRPATVFPKSNRNKWENGGKKWQRLELIDRKTTKKKRVETTIVIDFQQKPKTNNPITIADTPHSNDLHKYLFGCNHFWIAKKNDQN